MRTSPIALKKPTPVEEADTIIDIFDSTLFDTIPVVYRRFDDWVLEMCIRDSMMKDQEVKSGQEVDAAVESDSTDPFATKDPVPVPAEDRAPGKLRGAGARSPLFLSLIHI